MKISSGGSLQLTPAARYIRNCKLLTLNCLLLLLLFHAAAFAERARASLEELKQRADAASPGDQPKLFLEIAELQLKAAETAYKQNQNGQGRLAVEEVAGYSERSAAVATRTRKHMKPVEIQIHKLARKLDALGQTLTFEDRAPARSAVERMEKARSDLLAAMFASK